MSSVAVGTALSSTMTLAIEALKQIPNFDERKLKALEQEKTLLDHAIVNEDSDLLISTIKRIKNLSITYAGVFKK